MSVTSNQSHRILVAVIVGLGWTVISGDAARTLAPNGIAGLPYSRSLLASLSDTLVLVGLLRVVGGVRLGRIVSVIGLRKPDSRAMAALGFVFASASVACLLASGPSDALQASHLLWLGIGGPVFEEIAYRGLALGGLIAFAGWRFLPAALIPSMVFGIAHASQGQSLIEAGGIAAITGIGSLLFGWMYIRWKRNLWPAILAHCGMNTLWEVFALGDSAMGHWYGNVVRLTLVVAIVGSTWWLTRAKPVP
ncbi:MAG: CPBP family intramembrane glutamic endopeptidase [Pseudomonadota bacterium]